MVYGEILWTADAEAHIARHGVAPEEVEEAIYGSPRWVDKGREGTRLVYGRSSRGRGLFVVLSESRDGRDFVVTARELTPREKRVLREKGR